MKSIAAIAKSATVQDAARRMEKQRVGHLLVLDARKKPVGLVTDRDLTLRVIAAGKDPARTTVAQVMSAPLATASIDEPLDAWLLKMESRGIRHLAIVDRAKVVRIVTIEELLCELGREIGDLGLAVTARSRTRGTRK